MVAVVAVLGLGGCGLGTVGAEPSLECADGSAPVGNTCADEAASNDNPRENAARARRGKPKGYGMGTICLEVTLDDNPRNDVLCEGPSNRALNMRRWVCLDALSDDNPRNDTRMCRVPGGSTKPKPVRVWTCAYSPTMNRDWHDDALCTDGVAHERPYLLPNDSFITRAELMAAAAEHEAWLNSRR